MISPDFNTADNQLQLSKNGHTPAALALLNPNQLETALYATDSALVHLSEQAHEQTLALLAEAPPLRVLRDARDTLQAVDVWLRPKMQTRELKIEARNNLTECILRLDRATGMLIKSLQEQGLLAGGQGGDKRSFDMMSKDSYTSAGITGKQASRWKMMATLPEEEFEETIREAKENGWELTSYDMLQRAKNAPIMTSSADVEYYTPAVYIEAARRVMGVIDLDPASCETANQQVQATAYYTKAMDGLSHPWKGNVWLNPPYGALAADFGQALIERYRAGDVIQAIALFNAHVTDTRWFAPFWDYLVCFTDHRINFLNTDDKSGSTHGSCFVYLGDHQADFVREFRLFGVVVKKIS